MSSHRAVRATLSLVLVVSAWTAMVPRAHAQEPTGIVLTLASQTAANSPEEPGLRVSVLAQNPTDQVFSELSVSITIGQAIRSRNQYDTSLREGPGISPLSVTPFIQDGSLDPGQARVFSVELDVGTAGVDPADSLVYPAQIDVRSAGVALAALNTAVVYIVRTPERPVRLAWWAEITAPPAFDPQGRLADPTFEASIAPEGSLGAEVASLLEVATDPKRGDPIDVVIEPAVIDQLTRMADGFERSDGSSVEAGRDGAATAQQLLTSMRTIAQAPGIQISAMPFSAPQIPSLLDGALALDLERQRAAGAVVLDAALGINATTAVARPPQGALNDAAVDALAATGATTILADPDTVERPPQANDFAPLPTAGLTTSAGAAVQLILPDPGSQALLADPTLLADPVRAAQAVYGELATLWREAPVPADQPDGTETVRGIAVGLPAGLPAALWGPLTRRLADAPFLAPTFAQEFAARVTPAGPPSTILEPSTQTFSRTYVEGILDERRAVDAFRSMLVEADPEPDALDRDLLYAESGIYLGESGEAVGRAWIDQVHATTEAVFAQAQPRAAETFTFTSGEGTIPLRMGDPGPTPLKIIVQLRSAWFRFPDGATQTITLSRPNQVVSFRVQTTTAGGGAHPIQMLVRAPSGRPLEEPQVLVVRTAAVNRVAVVITALAALGLAVLWARRLIRVRRGAHAH